MSKHFTIPSQGKDVKVENSNYVIDENISNLITQFAIYKVPKLLITQFLKSV